ncbi:hypothetical protein KIJ05_08880 [Leuconostoc gelidum subsp. gasicomitatum]|uniref:hypothetical protein n=1 Tax=Leuconostoc gasicomitatum TaxID=115778 RepID=UPI001CC6DC1D|nr:hypothetical protein [Leuconostoc gasicomitatum]MBZ5985224.1 hypothetical protein [Leuconostoc gasicomitatum]
MVNKFNKLSLQGKSLGKLTYVSRNKVGTNGDISVAVLNINDTLNTENITPQAGFDFAKPFGTELKLINASIIGGEDRSNRRGGTRVATKYGTLLPMSDSQTDGIPGSEYDAVFVSGKDKTPVGRVRSTDAFDSHDLILFSVAPNYRTDNPVRDDNGEPIISNYQVNFMQQSKSGEVNDDNTFIRILIDPTESERLQVDLKPGTKLVPQGLKFAFVGNNATDWTVYADTLKLSDNNNFNNHERKTASKSKNDPKNK